VIASQLKQFVEAPFCFFQKERVVKARLLW